MDGREQVGYDADMLPHCPTAQTPDPPADLAASSALLVGLREDFPAFRISREIIGDRIQYVARRRDPGTHPHTVVTADPDGLRSALAASHACPGQGTGGTLR
jgi:hypothetical protein